MGKKISITKYIIVNPGDSGEVIAYEVDPAKTFRTQSIYIAFPPGTYFDLELSIMRGIKQIAPYSGTYRGDASVIEDEFVDDISSGEHVIIKYKNNSTTQIREAFVIIRGELVG